MKGTKFDLKKQLLIKTENYEIINSGGNQKFNSNQFLAYKQRMGCAASKEKDPFTAIVEKYGDEKVKEFIVGMSRVQFIESNRDTFLASLQQKIQNISKQLMHQVDMTKMQIDKKYERSITRIQQANPKAMTAAQKTFKVKIQQLMGYKDVLKKFYDYKEQSRLSLQREESHTLSYLTNFFKELQEQQRDEIPQMKKYQALDDDEQEEIFKTGKKKYKAGVKKGLQKLQTTILDKCNFQNFQPKFNSIVTKEKLSQLVHSSEKVFMAGEEKIKGASDCKTC